MHSFNSRRSHSAIRIPHSAIRIPHSAFRIPHSAFRIPHSAFRNPRSAIRIRLRYGIIFDQVAFHVRLPGFAEFPGAIRDVLNHDIMIKRGLFTGIGENGSG